MNLLEAKTFARNCSKDELNELIHTINTIQNNRRNEAKAHFDIGDTVTSDDPRWYYGNGTIEKINRKNLVVRCNGRLINVSPGLLRKVK
jgi:hypothetical protein